MSTEMPVDDDDNDYIVIVTSYSSLITSRYPLSGSHCTTTASKTILESFWLCVAVERSDWRWSMSLLFCCQGNCRWRMWWWWCGCQSCRRVSLLSFCRRSMVRYCRHDDLVTVERRGWRWSMSLLFCCQGENLVVAWWLTELSENIFYFSFSVGTWCAITVMMALLQWSDVVGGGA
jgi:hypothetical protein